MEWKNWKESVFKRLDRGLENSTFFQGFPQNEVQDLISGRSDHAPLYVIFWSLQVPIVKSFKFLNFWTKHQYYRWVVVKVSELKRDGSPFCIFNKKLKKLKKALALWSKGTYGDSFQKLATLEDVVIMKKVQLEVNPSEANREELRKVEADLQSF